MCIWLALMVVVGEVLPSLCRTTHAKHTLRNSLYQERGKEVISYAFRYKWFRISFTIHATAAKESWLLISVWRVHFIGSLAHRHTTCTPQTPPKMVHLTHLFVRMRIWHPSSSMRVYACLIFYGWGRWRKVCCVRHIVISSGNDLNKVFIEMFSVWITTTTTKQCVPARTECDVIENGSVLYSAKVYMFEFP